MRILHFLSFEHISMPILIIILLHILVFIITSSKSLVNTRRLAPRIEIPLRFSKSAWSKQCTSSSQSVACPTSFPLSQFLPYGLDAGDTMLPPGDDESSGQIPLSMPFPFMNHRESILFVNINGLISFNTDVADFKPKCNSLQISKRLVAPFWTDVTTDNGLGGSIYYRQSTDPELLKKVRLL